MLKSFKSKLVVAVASFVPLLASAQQAGDPFSAAVTTATTNVTTYGAALVGLSAIGVGFMIGMKYVKKIRGAA